MVLVCFIKCSGNIAKFIVKLNYEKKDLKADRMFSNIYFAIWSLLADDTAALFKA